MPFFGREGLDTFLKHDDQQFQELLESIAGNWDTVLEELPPEPEEEPKSSDRMPLRYLTDCDNGCAVIQCDLDQHAAEVTLQVDHPACNTLPDTATVLPGQSVVYKVANDETRRAVVTRDDDLLTPQQASAHWPEVQAAMLKELNTWAQLKCFSRRPRASARNIIDTRWVLKFKWEQPTVDVNTSGNKSAKA